MKKRLSDQAEVSQEVQEVEDDDVIEEEEGEAEIKEVGFVKGFKVPSASVITSAARAPREKQIPAEFDPTSPLFEPLRVPSHELDWLAQWREPRQSFQVWLREYYRAAVVPYNKLYILPLELHSKEMALYGVEKLPLKDVLEFAQLFLGPLVSQVCLMNNLVLDTATLETRRCHPWHDKDYNEQHIQVNTSSLGRVIKKVVPTDSRATLGVCMFDLFMDHTDEFTAGFASPQLLRGVSTFGCFSMARYDPDFDRIARPKGWKSHLDNPPPAKETEGMDPKALLLMRCCKIVAHEVLHMFGLGHCVFFQCMMNGSGHISEDDSQPMHLCPVDLRKFVYLAKEKDNQFSVINWMSNLAKFFEKNQITREAKWLEDRLAEIQAEGSLLPANPKKRKSSS